MVQDSQSVLLAKNGAHRFFPAREKANGVFVGHALSREVLNGLVKSRRDR
jgi:hypothetical protein